MTKTVFPTPTAAAAAQTGRANGPRSVVTIIKTLLKRSGAVAEERIVDGAAGPQQQQQEGGARLRRRGAVASAEPEVEVGEDFVWPGSEGEGEAEDGASDFQPQRREVVGDEHEHRHRRSFTHRHVGRHQKRRFW